MIFERNSRLKSSSRRQRRSGKVYSSIRLDLPNSPVLTPLTEKLEDAKARAAIKAQIEADKKARAEKAAREKALREGKAFPEDATSAAPAASASSATSALSGTSGKDYPQTRLQIRMATGGQPYTTTLSSDASEYATQRERVSSDSRS